MSTIFKPYSTIKCYAMGTRGTHRLGAGQGDVPDLLADELQLGVVPLPLPLLRLQTRDQIRPEEKRINVIYSIAFTLSL